MKEVKLIEEAIRSTNEDSIRKMLEQFLLANTLVILNLMKIFSIG